MALQNGVWLVGPDGIPHQVPDNNTVIASFVGRGWTVTDLPAHLDPDDEEFQNALAQLQQAEDDEAEPQPADEEPEPAQPVAAAPATEKKEVK